MLQIDDVVVSFDVLREKFLCNLDACKRENVALKGMPVLRWVEESRETGRDTACDLG